MINLLSKYSITEILIIGVGILIAIKELWQLIDWFKNKNKEEIDKHIDEQQDENRLDQLEEKVDSITQSVESLEKMCNLLISSDKDDIKSYITDKHHFFCYCQGWIDDYSLDCLEKRYGHYKEEKGNSFIDDLMVELRSLPKQDPKNTKN